MSMAGMAVNTAMMVGFALPGIGPALGSSLAIIGFLIGLDDARKASNTMADQLKAIKQILDDQAWNNSLTNLQQQVTNLYADFLDKMDGMGKVQVLAGKMIPPDGSYVSRTDDYFDTTLSIGPYETIDNFRSHLEVAVPDASAKDDVKTTTYTRRHQTAALYGLLGSFLVAFLKASVNWQWGKIVLKQGQWDLYQAALEKCQTQAAIDNTNAQYPELVQKVGNNWQPIFDPAKNTWETWQASLGAESPVDLLDQLVTKLVSYADQTPAANGNPAQDGLFRELRAGYTALDAAIVSADAAQAAQIAQWKQLPAQVAANLPPDYEVDLDFTWTGPVRATAWAKTTQEHYLAGIAEDDVVSLEKTVKLWKGAIAAMRYTTYEVQPGDTVKAIRALKYGTATPTRIEDGRGNVLDDSNPLIRPAGQRRLVLKIFNSTAIADYEAALAL